MEKTKTLGLLRYYTEAEKEIKELDKSFLNVLYTSEGDVLSKLRSRIERMKNRDYVVLVAGTCIYILHKAT